MSVNLSDESFLWQIFQSIQCLILPKFISEMNTKPNQRFPCLQTKKESHTDRDKCNRLFAFSLFKQTCRCGRAARGNFRKYSTVQSLPGISVLCGSAGGLYVPLQAMMGTQTV